VALDPDGKNFVVSGPNGSGKSGVVDAIQFGLTGGISRLSGKGTAGLSVQGPRPHVDKCDDPEAAEVSLTLVVPNITRFDSFTEKLPLDRISAEFESGTKSLTGDRGPTALQLKFAESRVIERVFCQPL
jgi:DNA repair exonuclease SbcCD ATPase subunit